MSFNPNELILEKVRSVEAYDPTNGELIGRYSQIEEPSLKTSAEGLDVTDALGTPIHTFYHNQQATFDGSNSLFALDLAASQFGTEKKQGSADGQIEMPVSETLEITKGTENSTVLLTHTPANGVSSVTVVNENNTFGKIFKPEGTEGVDANSAFTLDAESKTITLPKNTAGRVFVNYEYKTTDAVLISKDTEKVPPIQKLIIHAIFHDPSNANLVYAGAIVCPRAQLDPTSVELSLKADGKHPFSYKLQKPYAAENGRLFDIIVSEK